MTHAIHITIQHPLEEPQVMNYQSLDIKNAWTYILES
jgi:hypothetical protein